ncbi:MAG: hypothetical protein M1840_001221 [Geoglossum simile]|nr:MAG: hypothetical protein M1840_001221 [Geoglossum simile]
MASSGLEFFAFYYSDGLLMLLQPIVVCTLQQCTNKQIIFFNMAVSKHQVIINLDHLASSPLLIKKLYSIFYFQRDSFTKMRLSSGSGASGLYLSLSLQSFDC